MPSGLSLMNNWPVIDPSNFLIFTSVSACGLDHGSGLEVVDIVVDGVVPPEAEGDELVAGGVITTLGLSLPPCLVLARAL